MIAGGASSGSVTAIVLIVLLLAFAIRHANRKGRRWEQWRTAQVAAALADHGFAVTSIEQALPAPPIPPGYRVFGCHSGVWKGRPILLCEAFPTRERTGTTVSLSIAAIKLDADCPLLVAGRAGDPSLEFPDGLELVDFESISFDESVRVACADAEFAHAFIDQRMMRFLLGTSEGTSFRVVGAWATAVDSLVEPEALGGFLKLAGRFSDHIPPVVTSMYPGA